MDMFMGDSLGKPQATHPKLTVTMRALLVIAVLALAGCNGPSGGTEPLPAEWRGRDLRQAGWSNVTIEPGWTHGVEYQD